MAGRTLDRLGMVQAGSGHPEAAQLAWRQALALFEQVGAPRRPKSWPDAPSVFDRGESGRAKMTTRRVALVIAALGAAAALQVSVAGSPASAALVATHRISPGATIGDAVDCQLGGRSSICRGGFRALLELLSSSWIRRGARATRRIHAFS
jgi:hypothetical protein